MLRSTSRRLSPMLYSSRCFEVPFLPPTPEMGHHSSHRHWRWGTIPPTTAHMHYETEHHTWGILYSLMSSLGHFPPPLATLWSPKSLIVSKLALCLETHALDQSKQVTLAVQAQPCCKGSLLLLLGVGLWSSVYDQLCKVPDGAYSLTHEAWGLPRPIFIIFFL